MGPQKRYLMNYHECTITELENAVENLLQMIKGCQYPEMLPEYKARLAAANAALMKKKAALDRKGN